MPGYKSDLTAVDPKHGTSKLKAVADKGGVSCAIFVAQPDVNAIVDDLETMIQHVGDDYVGLGSDFCESGTRSKGVRRYFEATRHH